MSHMITLENIHKVSFHSSLFSEGTKGTSLYASLRFYFSTSDWWKISNVSRRRETLYDVARLLLMVPLEPGKNSTPFLGSL